MVVRRRRSRRVRARFVVLLVAALLVSTPWGAGAISRVKTSAVTTVQRAFPELKGADSAQTPPPAVRAGNANRRLRAKIGKARRQQAPQSKQPASLWQVSSVIDGDTIDVVSPGGQRERVRFIGIDTPERGMCGYTEASNTLRVLVDGEQVALSPGAVDDRDTYGRLLRYVDVGGADAGQKLIERGLAVARYDSRDGYGHHPREAAYVTADAAAPDVCASGAAAAPAVPVPVAEPVPAGGGGIAPPGGGAWPGCNEARAAGAAPVYAGDAGYGSHLDGDGDGVGCE